MRVIENPTEEQLSELQNKLSKEANAGIVDIYGCMVQYYFALESNMEIIGVAAISPLGDDSVEIFKLYIDPKQRKNGLGHLLLGETIKRLAGYGFKEVVIETTPASHEFWEKTKPIYNTTYYDINKFGINIGGR